MTSHLIYDLASSLVTHSLSLSHWFIQHWAFSLSHMWHKDNFRLNCRAKNRRKLCSLTSVDQHLPRPSRHHLTLTFWGYFCLIRPHILAHKPRHSMHFDHRPKLQVDRVWPQILTVLGWIWLLLEAKFDWGRQLFWGYFIVVLTSVDFLVRAEVWLQLTAENDKVVLTLNWASQITIHE